MTKAVSRTLTRRRFVEDSCAAALLLGGAAAAVSEAAERAKPPTDAPDADWGPLAGPWKRYDGNPVMKIGDFNQSYSIQNGPQTVVRKDGRWYMTIMTATSYDTRLAVSDDGFRWRPSGHGPVIRPDKPWEGRYALTKALVPFGDGFRAYYFNKRGRIEDICTAYSDDLIHWEKHPGPIFTAKDARTDGERVFPGSAVQYDGKWYLFYDIAWDYGWRGIGPPPGPEFDYQQICVAVSDDGIHFEDSPKSPILSPGEVGAWDGYLVGQCRVLQLGDWFYMLYSGMSRASVASDGNRGPAGQRSDRYFQQIGLARARHPEGAWEKYPGNPVFSPTGNPDDWDGGLLQHVCPVQIDGLWLFYYNGWNWKENATNPVGAEYGIGIAICEE